MAAWQSADRHIQRIPYRDAGADDYGAAGRQPFDRFNRDVYSTSWSMRGDSILRESGIFDNGVAISAEKRLPRWNRTCSFSDQPSCGARIHHGRLQRRC